MTASAAMAETHPHLFAPLPIGRRTAKNRIVFGAHFTMFTEPSPRWGEPGFFGERLVFPECFVGRGDMSRGGVMLRAAESGKELAYVSVSGATRKGTRPPKLTESAFR